MIRQNLSILLLKWLGWTLKAEKELPAKCVICLAPHTSNWDFLYGQLAGRALNLNSRFFMKKEWFFFPLGFMLKAMGGIPINRKKKQSMVDSIIKEFDQLDAIRVAISPEGTRKPNPNWKKGFYYIAFGAKVPIVLAYIDFEKREIGVEDTITPCGDIEKDFDLIRGFYRTKKGKIPANFVLPE